MEKVKYAEKNLPGYCKQIKRIKTVNFLFFLIETN